MKIRMNEFLKMNIFFMISSASVVLVTFGVLIVLYYLVRILRTVDVMLELVHVESEKIVADIEDVRLEVKAAGSRVIGTIGGVLKIVGRIFRALKKRK